MNDNIAFLGSTLGLLVALILALNLTQGMARFVSRLGLRYGIVSPVTDRSSHTQPKSRLGGVAMLAGFLIPSCLFVTILYFLPRSSIGWGGDPEFMAWLALGAVLMFGVGLADDLWDLNPGLKLSGQILAALAILPAGLHFQSVTIPAPPAFSPEVSSAFAAVCWVVFFVNVFNFMDGSDGFAIRFAMSSCAWVAAMVFLQAGLDKFVFFIRAEFFLVLILGAAGQGFYRENRSPASVFLGDSGSHLVGYLLAVMLLLGDGGYFATWPELRPSIDAAPAGSVAIVLLPFYFDVLVTLIRRARLGQNLIAPHREHLYQRLLKTGMTHGRVLRFNLSYFYLCGFIGLVNALIPEEVEDVEPYLLVLAHVGLWLFALLAMTDYWRRVVAIEQTGGRKAAASEPTGA